MSLLSSLADAGKAAAAVQSAGKLISEAAPLIEKAKELKASHPEIYNRVMQVGEKFKTVHPVASAAASEIEKALVAKIPELTAGCDAVSKGGDPKALLGKLGDVEGLVSKLAALK